LIESASKASPASATGSSKPHSIGWFRAPTEALLALGVLVVFHLSVFGAGAAIQWRRHGHTGFAAHAGVNAAERTANLLYVIWALGDCIDAIARLTHGGASGLVALGVAGLLCALAALVIGTIARVSMDGAWRTSADGAHSGGLVTTGFFALVRNPVYVAMVLLALGVSFLIPDVWTVLALIAAAVGLEIQVRAVEEPHLRAVYGSAYDGYAARTGRFVPLLGRLR
jgi:protein-S-isoprenylcysteine O-methyltransferase Ste14